MADATNQAASADDLRRVLIDVTACAGPTLGEIAVIAKLALAGLEKQAADVHTNTLKEALRSIWAKAEDAQNVVEGEAETVSCYFDADDEAARQEAKRPTVDPLVEQPAPGGPRIDVASAVWGLRDDMTYQLGAVLNAARLLAHHQRVHALIQVAADAEPAVAARLKDWCPTWRDPGSNEGDEEALIELLRVACVGLKDLADRANKIGNTASEDVAATEGGAA